LGSSIHLESTAVSELAQRIGDARKLYGNDSPYVIGMMTAVEWIAQGVEGGQGLKQDLLARVLESEGKKQQPSRPLPASAESSPPTPDRRALAENTWTRGVVKWFNNDKGYGFISTDGHVDVFVHWRDISSWDRSLTQDDEVEFMVTRTAKGFQAINVMKAGQDKAEEAEGEVDSAASAATEAPDETGEAEQVAADGAPFESEGSAPDPQDGEGRSVGEDE
jgi:CspA family cold shock protein